MIQKLKKDIERVQQLYAQNTEQLRNATAPEWGVFNARNGYTDNAGRRVLIKTTNGKIVCSIEDFMIHINTDEGNSWTCCATLDNWLHDNETALMFEMYGKEWYLLNAENRYYLQTLQRLKNSLKIKEQQRDRLQKRYDDILQELARPQLLKQRAKDILQAIEKYNGDDEDDGDNFGDLMGDI